MLRVGKNADEKRTNRTKVQLKAQGGGRVQRTYGRSLRCAPLKSTRTRCASDTELAAIKTSCGTIWLREAHKGQQSSATELVDPSMELVRHEGRRVPGPRLRATLPITLCIATTPAPVDVKNVPRHPRHTPTVRFIRFLESLGGEVHCSHQMIRISDNQCFFATPGLV